MGDLEGGDGVLLDEQHGDAVDLVDLADDVEDLVDQEGREAETGLVEHQQLRLGHQRAGDGEHLLLAARQVAGLGLGALGEAREGLEHAVDQRRHVAAVAVHGGGGDEVFLRRQVTEDPPALEHMGDAEADAVRRVQGENIAARKGDLAARDLAALGLQQA